MKIVLFPDPLLHETCEAVELGDKCIKRLSKQMLKLMYKSDGVGLAAPQVAVLKRLIVIDTDYASEQDDGTPKPKNPIVLVNPEIVDHCEQRIKGSEGCLSCPGINVEVDRWEWVKVKACDENFNEHEYYGEGLFGRCMQHEIDHLNGITLFERVRPAERVKVIEAYNAALAAGAKPGDC